MDDNRVRINFNLISIADVYLSVDANWKIKLGAEHVATCVNQMLRPGPMGRITYSLLCSLTDINSTSRLRTDAQKNEKQFRKICLPIPHQIRMLLNLITTWDGKFVDMMTMGYLEHICLINNNFVVNLFEESIFPEVF